MFEATDLFSAIFGSQAAAAGMHSGGRGMQRASTDVQVPLSISLEELYNGTTKQISRTRTNLCSTCHGRGTDATVSRAETRCPICRGQGARVMVEQMGMLSRRVQVACSACRGTGERNIPGAACSACNGRRVQWEESQLTVTITRGMKDNETIVFKGKGDTHPDVLTPGDVVVVLQTDKHPTFVRNGDDLHVRRNITLAEALCGFQFKLTHLDGRELSVRRNRGEITRPGEMNMIKGEGMPVKGRSGKNGDLFVHLDIVYPDTLSPEQLTVLRAALPQTRKLPAINEEDGDYHTCYATRTSVAEFRAEMEQEEIEDDDDEGDGVHVSGCPMQ